MEEKKLESKNLDLSSFLFETEPKRSLKWEFDKWKSREILYLNIQVEIDKPLLSSFLRNKLNPL
jgi:hypothetical protein